jgi:hypothetical protein
MNNDTESAKFALEFMKRVQLTGAEVAMFNQVNHWLLNKVNPPVTHENKPKTK